MLYMKKRYGLFVGVFALALLAMILWGIAF